MSWLKNRLETSEFNNILNLLKTEKNIPLLFAITYKLYLSFEFLQQLLVVNELILHEAKFNTKSFANKKI